MRAKKLMVKVGISVFDLLICIRGRGRSRKEKKMRVRERKKFSKSFETLRLGGFYKTVKKLQDI